MKKNFLKFVALLAIALPMAIMTSCDDDDDDVMTGMTHHLSQMDAETYLKHHWLNYNEAGDIEGVSIGTILYESEPTVAYVGVEDLLEAQLHFAVRATPYFASLEEYKDNNMDAVLSDSLGNEVNRIKFTVVNDGKVIAKAKLQNNIGIERYLTEIRYIAKTLWPENALINNLPFRTGCMYTFKGHTYTCVSTPGYGRDGLLVRDKNNFRYIGTLGHSLTEQAVACYPNINTMLQISKELNSTVAGSQLWQQLCVTAGETNLKEFKTREYWTSTTDADQIMVVNLANPKQYLQQTLKFMWPWNEAERTKQSSRWELEAYKFYTVNGEVVMKICNEGIWMKEVENPNPNVAEWVRNEAMEKTAQAIKLQ